MKNLNLKLFALILVSSSAFAGGQSQGVYVSQGDTNSWDSARFNKGCINPGDYMSDSVSGINPDFTQGIKFWETNSSKNDSTSGISYVLETSVDASNSGGYNLTETYLSASGVPGASSGAKVQENWQLKTAKPGDTATMFGMTLHPKPGNTYFDVSANPSNLGILNIKPPRGCATFDSGTTVKNSSTFGTFTFAKTGQKVKAFMRDATQTNVKLVCYFGMPIDSATTTDEGLGTFTRTVISTNEIPSETNHCGGVSIFIREKAVNAKGEVLEDSTYEMLGFQK